MLDDTGSADDGITTAAATFGRLIEAVQSAGGPAYQYAQIDPADNQDGGTGENARLGFLYNPARVTVDPAAGDMAGSAEGGRGRLLCARPGPFELQPCPDRPEQQHLVRAAASPWRCRCSLAVLPCFIIGIDLVSKEADSPLFGAHAAATAPVGCRALRTGVRRCRLCPADLRL